MKKKRKRLLVVAALAVAVAGALALWNWQFAVRYATAQATVLSREERYAGEISGPGGIPSPRYRPYLVLQFSTAQGMPVTASVLGPGSLRASKGDTLEVHYRKSDPTKCVVFDQTTGGQQRRP